MLTLEKYKGSASRHTCPVCGRKKKFTRYIDTETGRYIADNVGRCDRESSCGYHLKPGEYFEDNRTILTPYRRDRGWRGRRPENGPQRLNSRNIKAKKADYIDKLYLLASLRDYEQNAFVQFLLNLFPFDPEDVTAVVKEYKIGTGRNGEAIFWQIDAEQRIRTGKLVAYDPNTGKRRKDRSPNWVHAALKRSGQLAESFELGQCFFGEHLLSKYPGRAIAIVEAEKTAVIASICKRVFPDLVWLACGGLSNLNAGSLAQIATGRKLILFPDANGFNKWQTIASEARKAGIDVSVSSLLEREATEAEKRDGLDLADYLICEQQKRNDPIRRSAFADLIEEKLAIVMSDGGLSLTQAENYLERSGFIKWAEDRVLSR